MPQVHPQYAIRIDSVFHPSDFSAASEVAFFHALKIALAAQAELNMLHATDDSQNDWHDFPGVRETLERWKLIPPNSPKSAVANLGIEVRKVVKVDRDPVHAATEFLRTYRADLIVLAVRQHEGRMRWLQKSIGKPLARAAGQMTLFIPHGTEGFVSRADGSVSLRNVLVPVAATPRPQPAIEAVRRLVRSLPKADGTVTVLHVGAESAAPAVKLPDDTPGWQWKRVAVPGEPVEVIVKTAESISAGLIAMTTDGPEGFLDALRGSTSERVLRKANCPVLSLPVGSMLG